MWERIARAVWTQRRWHWVAWTAAGTAGGALVGAVLMALAAGFAGAGALFEPGIGEREGRAILLLSALAGWLLLVTLERRGRARSRDGVAESTGRPGRGEEREMRMAFRQRRLVDELRDFFGEEPLALPIVSRVFSPVDLPNLHRAIQEYAREHGAELRIVGFVGATQGFNDQLRDMIGQDPRRGEVTTGPVQYRAVAVDYDEEMACVESGLHLLSSPAGKIAAHVRREMLVTRGGLELEVMAAEPAASAFSAEIRDRVQRSSVFRGKILSLDTPEDRRQITAGMGGVAVSFRRFPELTREQIILPEALLTLLERNTLGFLQHAATLLRSGRSVKRGLLLHGPPGTGKTLTAKWLAQTIPDVTVILLSAEQLGYVKECCRLARALAPALVIMEDVDLIAAHRDETNHPSAHVLLHQLLNEMDGLAANAEVIFLLTTNRPDVLEPALASRPGRVDQAIAFPLPDAECRRRLLELYGQGLTLALAEPDRLIARTEGASPAFIQELVRKATLFAAEEGAIVDGVPRLTDAHFDAAIAELVLGGGELTRHLLGFIDPPVEPPPASAGGA